MTLLAEADSLTRVTATHHQIPSPAMPPPAPAYGRPRHFPLNAIATLIVGLIATAALVVGILGLTRDNSNPVSETPPVSAGPSFSPADSAAAKSKVCDAFERARLAANTATNAPDGSEPEAVGANARASLVMSALALTRAVSDATPPAVASAAEGLADAYSAYALSVYAAQPGDKASVNEAVAAMREACA